jgi:Fe-S cluster biogenesis protein NfuA
LLPSALTDPTTDIRVTPPPPSLESRVARELDRLRPALRADGGDVELVRVDAGSGRVELRFVGACQHCPASSYTLTYSLSAKLRAALPEVLDVVAV